MHGYLVDRHYYKSINIDKHKLKKPPRFWEHGQQAFAMDVADWEQIKEKADDITYFDESLGQYWYISRGKFDVEKIPFNYGSHPQYCVLEDQWENGIWESKGSF